jgi:hypothetical protein
LSVQGMFFGFRNQLKPSEYPESWMEAEKLLGGEHAERVLVLPWWGYVRLPFAHNKLVDNPAQRYFTPDVVSSKKFENSHIDSLQSAWDRRIDSWVASGSLQADDWDFLRSERISHLILLSEEDTPNYEFLSNVDWLDEELVRDEIRIYKVK